ncbi:hypothetical protein PV04_06275 [Phialophora macrospora]|uniref:Heterokaryon incompatibility domain-containing protein n=1 Tax=Phialophora macrospora TaxID=1851006 RepID=A0A0D2DY11_9EURO|nr:hypothetical protein PV04_06275 [Phialophora macrospora]
MEHAPIPPDSVHPPSAVPLIALEPLPPSTFSEVPKTSGWDARLSELFQGAKNCSTSEWDTLSAFLQNWLFFGLLASFLRERYARSAFIRAGTGTTPSQVTTVGLNAVLEDLIDTESDLPDQARMERSLQRSACLDQTAEVLSQLPGNNSLHPTIHLSICLLYEKLRAANAVVQSSWKPIPPFQSCVIYGSRILKRLYPKEGQDPLPEKVKSKIIAICRRHSVDPTALSISDAVNRVSDGLAYEVGLIAVHSNPAVIIHNWPRLKFIEERLASDGWCPTERSLLFRNYNVTCQFYASHLSRPGLDKDHVEKQCTESQCNAYLVDVDRMADYETVHSPRSCNCDHIPMDHQTMAGNLARDIVPAVELDVSDRKIKVVPTQAGSYVAISHVWSDGLGNLRTNSLPQCQMRRLCNYHQGTDLSPRPIWIDTLCCPREPLESRRAAIRLMRQTYRDASSVVVLDAWLNNMSIAKLSRPEIMFRIALSGWTRRLWTLQEGMLNKSAFVWFKDGMVDTDSLVQNMVLDSPLEFLPMVRLLSAAYGSLRGMVRRNLDMRTRLIGLSNSLQFRSTSWEGDEPICLGILLDLNVDDIWKQKVEDRMKELWLQISDIPLDVVFDVTPNLPHDNYHWAPVTIFGHNFYVGPEGSHSGGLWARESPNPLGKITTRGLQAELTGFIGDSPISELMQTVQISLLEFVDQLGQPYIFFRVPVPKKKAYDSTTIEEAVPSSEELSKPGRWTILVLGFRPLVRGISYSPAIIGKAEYRQSAGNEDAMPFRFISYGSVMRFANRVEFEKTRPFEGPFVASEHSLKDSMLTYEALMKQFSEISLKEDQDAKPGLGLEGLGKINISEGASGAETASEWRFEKIERGQWLLT